MFDFFSEKIAVGSGITLFNSLKSSGVIVTSGAWSAINLDGEVLKFQGWSGLTEKIAADATLWGRLVSVWKQLNWKVIDANLQHEMPEVSDGAGDDNELQEPGQGEGSLPEVQ